MSGEEITNKDSEGEQNEGNSETNSNLDDVINDDDGDDEEYEFTGRIRTRGKNHRILLDDDEDDDMDDSEGERNEGNAEANNKLDDLIDDDDDDDEEHEFCIGDQDDDDDDDVEGDDDCDESDIESIKLGIKDEDAYNKKTGKARMTRAMSKRARMLEHGDEDDDDDGGGADDDDDDSEVGTARMTRAMSKRACLLEHDKDPEKERIDSNGFANDNTKSGFPSALTLYWTAESRSKPRSLFELQICQIEGAIREKEEWWNKIMDPKIRTKWIAEAIDQLPIDNTVDEMIDLEYRRRQAFYAIYECKWLAEKYKDGPVRPAAVDGVFSRDDLLNSSLQKKLLEGINVLRSKPAIGASKEDRHPGTPQMVDLVHPSLYAYERGKTQVLQDVGAEALKMPEWSTFLGHQGVVEPPLAAAKKVSESNQWWDQRNIDSLAGLQWLPAEFKVDINGRHCEINSYINSLHPEQHADLYKSISELFCHAVPLLEEVLAEAGEHKCSRPQSSSDMYVQAPRDVECRITVPKVLYDDEWWEGERDYEADEDNRTFMKPDIPIFWRRNYNRVKRAEVSLRDRPLQVIVKIASLELQPGESFAGGTWHVEGTLGERIVATACYYLEYSNMTGGELCFRSNVSEPTYSQDDHKGVRLMYGLGNEEALVQNSGYCVTKEGRALVWPNTKQHRVSPIHLKDPKKPGKRTILCFFLVDPTLRVRSTATVLPQQLAWVAEVVNQGLANVGVIEGGIQNQISMNLASPSVLTYEAACERRNRLMDERRIRTKEDSGGFLIQEFSLCEH